MYKDNGGTHEAKALDSDYNFTHGIRDTFHVKIV